jgi:hypothetical protein
MPLAGYFESSILVRQHDGNGGLWVVHVVCAASGDAFHQMNGAVVVADVPRIICAAFVSSFPFVKSVYIRVHPWWNKFFAKVGFSGFLLGNREKIAFATNAHLSPSSAKMPGA